MKATLGTTDAVVRTIEVRPSGRPETITKTGTLAAPRTFKVTGPVGSDPGDQIRPEGVLAQAGWIGDHRAGRVRGST